MLLIGEYVGPTDGRVEETLTLKCFMLKAEDAKLGCGI